MDRRETIIYIIGSILLTVAVFAVMPKFIEVVSSYFCDKKPRAIPDYNDDDSWGPEIVKRVE